MANNSTPNKKAMAFIAAQVQFVLTKDDLFSGTTPPEEGKKIFNDLMAKSEGFEVKPRRPKGRQVVIYVDPISEKKIFYGARIGKTKKLLVPMVEGKHLVEKTISSCPFVLMLWDEKNQIIYIQQNTTIFQKVELPIELIMLYLNSYLIGRGLVAKWELIREKGTFWNAIDEYESINSLSMELVGPNLFGSRIKKADDLLKALKEETNGTEFEIKVTNDDGGVNIKKDDELISSMGEMIDQGGGNLKISGKKKGSKKKGKDRTNLKRQYKTISADKDFDDTTLINSQKILRITDHLKEKNET